MASRDYALGRLGGARAGLLSAAGLEDMLSRPDLAGRLDALRGSVWEAAAAAAHAPDAVEEALAGVGRRETDRVLGDLGGTARRLLGAFLLFQDAQALKGPVRAVARSLPAERAAALLEPSPGLDLPALRELAASPDAAALAARLAGWQSPFAAAVAAHAAQLAGPGALAHLEVALDGVAQAALLRASRGPGEDRRVLRRLAAVRADLANAGTLLALSGEAEPAGLWAPGGTHIGEAGFRRLGALPPSHLPTALAEALESLLGPPARSAAALGHAHAADHLLGRALAREARREARRAPLSLAVPCAWILDLGEELRRVRLVLRAADLGYPPTALLDLLEA